MDLRLTSTILLAIATLSIGCGDRTQPIVDETWTKIPINDDDIASIQQCFEDYCDAILSKDGSRTLELVDSRTIDYYDELARRAINATKIEMDNLEIIDKYAILLVRSRYSAKELQELDGESVFKFWVAEGSLNTGAIEKLSLRNVRGYSNRAKATSLHAGSRDMEFSFSKEDGRWKVNLVAMTDQLNEPIKRMARESGLDEDSFLALLLEFADETQPTHAIWGALQSEE